MLGFLMRLDLLILCNIIMMRCLIIDEVSINFEFHIKISHLNIPRWSSLTFDFISEVKCINLVERYAACLKSIQKFSNNEKQKTNKKIWGRNGDKELDTQNFGMGTKRVSKLKSCNRPAMIYCASLVSQKQQNINKK